jgi:hypothetical protein
MEHGCAVNQAVGLTTAALVLAVPSDDDSQYWPEHMVAHMCGDLYNAGIGLKIGFIGSQYSYTLKTESLTITTESQLLLSLFRAQDLLQTQLALTGHQLTLLDSSPQLTVN